MLGDPVGHSLSPALHNAAFTAAGIDAVYVALRCDAGALGGLMRGLAFAGGGGNVTVPHKAAAAAHLDRASDAVRRTGACNTFWADEHGLSGDNTDVEGFAAAAVELGVAVEGARVLLLGAGGAAAAALCALVDGGAGEISILNRTPARARALRARFADAADRIRVLDDGCPRAPDTDTDAPDTDTDARASAASWNLVVNATSLGLRPDDPLPRDPSRIPDGCAVLDLVYAPGGTPFTRAARARGLAAADGSTMLLHQAAAAFRRWTGHAPPTLAMRAALPYP